jgi:uncharacterized protein (DUF2062 family)
VKFSRQIRYYYLRFIRLRGSPHELALGMAMGVFCGMLPIIPFQTALAVTLAIFFKGSKITAAIGTWVSNPLNWYFLYYYSYKLGITLLGLPEQRKVFSAVIESIRAGDRFVEVAGHAAGAGATFVTSFILGGVLLGIVFAPPAYFVFLPFFRSLKTWREERKERRRLQRPNT